MLASFTESLSDLADLAELASDEQDQDTLDEIAVELDGLEARLAGLEFRRMFQGIWTVRIAFRNTVGLWWY